MNGTHTLDEIPFRETNATAVDSDASGSFICLAGPRRLTVSETEPLKTSTRNVSVETNRQDINVVRWQKLANPESEGKFIASSSGQFVDIFSIGSNGLKHFSAFRAHSLNITDIDWCAHHTNSIVTCSINDRVNIWDVRDIRRASLQLRVIAGAEQAKWAPLVENVLCTAHGTDIRIWDIRSFSSPVQSIPAHLQKMCCVVWHPRDSVCFVTTSLDGYIKMWDISDLSKPRHSIGMLAAPVWKLKFSFDGEEFATVPLPQNGETSFKNALNAWKTSELENAQSLKCEDDIILDVCWQRSQIKRRAFNYLYSVSRSGKLRRYTMTPYEEPATDVTEPAVVCDDDADVDRMMEGSFDLEMDTVSEKNFRTTGGPPHRSGSFQHPRRTKNFIPFRRGVQVNSDEQTLQCGSSLATVLGPPPSAPVERVPSPCPLPLPVNSDYKVWIRAPNANGGVAFELEALRNLGTQGLSTDEINFTRAAVALTYEHYQSRKKINFILRFHPAYLKIHRVCLEIVEENCPLTKEQSSKLLELLNSTALTIMPDCTKGTVMARTLKKLPEIIESMKVFAPQTIDIPGGEKERELSSVSPSVEVEPQSMEHEVEESKASFKQSYSSPSPSWSMYDRYIPSPRNCGARFNGSGYLVIFGRVNPPKRKSDQPSREDTHKTSSTWMPTESIGGSELKKGASMEVRRNRSFKKTLRDAANDEREKESNRVTPRSLDDYNQELLLNCSQHMPPHLLQSTTVADKTVPSFGQSPSSSGGLYALFGNTTGLVGGTGPGVAIPLPHRLGSLVKTSSQRGPKASSSSMASGTSRSFSMQNVPLSLVAANRQRGNSLTGVLADDHYQPADDAPSSMVFVYDVSYLMPVSKELARKYRLFNGNALQLCLWNRQVAEEAGRRDLVQIWRIVEMCVRSGKASWRKHCSWKADSRPAKRPITLSHLNGSDSNCNESEDDDEPWAVHPFGRTLINNLLQYFERINDCQSAAVIICILSRQIKRDFEALRAQQEAYYCAVQKADPRKRSTSSSLQIRCEALETRLKQATEKASENLRKEFRPPSESKSKMSTVSDSTTLPVANTPQRKLSSLFHSAGQRITRKGRSDTTDSVGTQFNKTLNSALEILKPHSLPAQRSSPSTHRSHSAPTKKKKKIVSLLDPDQEGRFDEIRHQYADLLFRWRMYSKVAEVMKFSGNAPLSLPLHIKYKCRYCGSKFEKNICSNCSKKRRPLSCAVCQLPTNGLMTSCSKCHHGGHCSHMLLWFKSNTRCPTGCGCDCKARNF